MLRLPEVTGVLHLKGIIVSEPTADQAGLPLGEEGCEGEWRVLGTHFVPETPVSVLQVVSVHLLGEGRKRTDPVHIWGWGPPLGVQLAFELIRWPCLSPGTT